MSLKGSAGTADPSSWVNRVTATPGRPSLLFLLLGVFATLIVATEATESGAGARAHTNGWEVSGRARSPRHAAEPRDSSYCARCHDGSVASAVMALTPSTEADLREFKVRLGSVGDRDHPVGIEYARVQRARPRDLTHPAALPPAVKLVNGRVECTTCHDPASNLPAMLVLDHRRGTLCLACHRM